MKELNKKLWGGKPFENSIFHSLGGVGVGLLLASWGYAGSALGWILVLISVAGHIWAWRKK